MAKKKPAKKQNTALTDSLNNAKQFFNGSFLTRKKVSEQMPFLVFLVFLAFMYIYNRYHAEGIYMDSVKLKKEIKDLRTESMSIASELMYISNQTKVQQLTRQKVPGLKESVVPPYKIVVSD